MRITIIGNSWYFRQYYLTIRFIQCRRKAKYPETNHWSTNFIGVGIYPIDLITIWSYTTATPSLSDQCIDPSLPLAALWLAWMLWSQGDWFSCPQQTIAATNQNVFYINTCFVGKCKHKWSHINFWRQIECFWSVKYIIGHEVKWMHGVDMTHISYLKVQRRLSSCTYLYTN